MSKADEETNAKTTKINPTTKSCAAEGGDETAEKNNIEVQKQQRQLTTHPVNRDKGLIIAHAAEFEDKSDRETQKLEARMRQLDEKQAQ